MNFEKAGASNTEETINIAFETAKKRGIRNVVVASTFGDTGVATAEKFKDSGTNIIVVTHNSGFKDPGACEIESEKAKKIVELGGKVLTGTMVFRGIGNAIRQMCGGYSEEQLVASTLRMFGQGMKVCVEIAAMASDAGLVPHEDILTIAGTGRGADTCIIIKADSSCRFFNLKIKEIIVKPTEF